LKVNVTRAESENVSRNDLGDFIKEFLVNQAVKAANMFHNYQPSISPELVSAFGKYFKLSQTNDSVYRLDKSYRPPQRIEVKLGPMTVDTATSIKFNQVPSKLTTLMDMYFKILTGEYDNGKLGATFSR